MTSPIEGPTRRGFLGWMGKVGLTVVGGAAGVSVLGGTADAAGGKKSATYTYACCHLARPNDCPGPTGQAPTCPSGSRLKIWYCCMPGGSRTYACGECTTGSTCSSGTFKCSRYWTTSPNKCVA